MGSGAIGKLVEAITIGLMAFGLASCSAQVQSSESIADFAASSGESASGMPAPEIETLPQTGWTEAVPSEYLQASERQGSVERLDYDSLDYAGDGHAITKTAYVYTPYGYDPDDEGTRYDIVYLMHGWGGHVGEYFDYPGTKNVFDNLIANGDMPPAVIVSATFYHDGSDAGFGGSVAELRAFHEDFENNLMPAVEGRYRTYAADATPEGLAASRDHRAFGGFSLDSVTTWLELCHDYDYIRYFLPMSGSCWYYGGYGDFQFERNVDFIEQLVNDNDLDGRGYFVYHAVGTNDAVKSQSIGMADEMLARGVFALIYRPGSQTACEDLARAIAYLHEHADELGVSMDGYSLWGGSAGARMAAWLGAYGAGSFGEAACPRPAACIVNYTGLSEVTGDEPPTYSAVGTGDWIADWRTMQTRIERIRANGTDAEIEVFDGLPHGFGLGTGTTAEGWLDRALEFWERQFRED